MNNFEKPLNILIHQSNIILRNILQKELNNYDITAEQWAILIELYNDEGINQKELAKRCFKDTAALTRSLDILERRDIIKREKSSNDRREFLIFLTINGRKLVENLLPMVLEVRKRITSVLSEEENNMLSSLLQKLIKGLI
ncbi:MarR family winged helix-turn-helix transcriptional regulator [Clostridium sp. BSD9I1]|uniref:MarR family winged helix-turn-helix transcriptional regulator n=1 Tax=Clostridium sp. BSD9I1 TaxID=2003589 RepID=UPI001646A6AD|nr:MarR family transcriptional regulator [Clostridium sp. BSD9I1]